MNQFYKNQRYAYNENLTGQEVSYEEILEILAHRHDIGIGPMGDNDIM